MRMAIEKRKEIIKRHRLNIIAAIAKGDMRDAGIWRQRFWDQVEALRRDQQWLMEKRLNGGAVE